MHLHRLYELISWALMSCHSQAFLWTIFSPTKKRHLSCLISSSYTNSFLLQLFNRPKITLSLVHEVLLFLLLLVLVYVKSLPCMTRWWSKLSIGIRYSCRSYNSLRWRISRLDYRLIKLLYLHLHFYFVILVDFIWWSVVIVNKNLSFIPIDVFEPVASDVSHWTWAILVGLVKWILLFNNEIWWSYFWTNN